MHHPLPTLVLLAFLAMPAFAGEADAPAPPPPPPPPAPEAQAPPAPAPAATPPAPVPAAATPAPADAGNRGRNAWMQRMAADNPELKGVDLSTPEGQDKLRQVMQARMEKNAPQIRQRMAEAQKTQHAELKKTFAMPDEEFTAIEPLLAKVEGLRLQKGLVDRAAMPGMPGGPGAGPGGRRGGGPPMMDLKLLLGDTPLDPTAQELQDAVKALKAVIDDAQANATESAAATARLRKARTAFQAVLAKAEDELRAVLSQRQEAILVERGTLE